MLAPRSKSEGVLGKRCGSEVEIMDAKHHDLVLAITSHVPHLIAYNIVGTAADLESVTQGEVIKYSAGGFRDFTRIAASDPTMWRDVFLNNREAVLEMLGRFNEDLAALAAPDPLGRRRCAVQALHAHPRHPPRHHRRRPGHADAQFRPLRAGHGKGRAARARMSKPRRNRTPGAFPVRTTRSPLKAPAHCRAPLTVRSPLRSARAFGPIQRKLADAEGAHWRAPSLRRVGNAHSARDEAVERRALREFGAQLDQRQHDVCSVGRVARPDAGIVDPARPHRSYRRAARANEAAPGSAEKLRLGSAPWVASLACAFPEVHIEARQASAIKDRACRAIPA